MHKRTQSLIRSLAEGLSGYLTLQARCGLSTAYSEYLLYDPIVRIATHLQWGVRCEYKLPKTMPGVGDNRRLDLMFLHKVAPLAVAMEVKWARKPKMKVQLANDIVKLREVQAPINRWIDARLILVAGPHQINGQGVPSLRPSLNGIRAKPIEVRALGIGRTAWGTSVFAVKIQ